MLKENRSNFSLTHRWPASPKQQAKGPVEKLLWNYEGHPAQSSPFAREDRHICWREIYFVVLELQGAGITPNDCRGLFRGNYSKCFRGPILERNLDQSFDAFWHEELILRIFTDPSFRLVLNEDLD